MYSNDDLKRLGAHKFMPHVAELFDQEERQVLLRGKDTLGHAPIIGLLFGVWDEEYISKLRRWACVACAAKKWFCEAAIIPPWARAIPLPVSIADCQKLEQDENPRPNLVGLFGSSLMMLHYDYLLHPPPVDYISGLMADPNTPDHLRTDPELLREFPPRPLEGLDNCLKWSSPEMVFSELQRYLRLRQRWQSRGMLQQTEWADERIAQLSQIYPGRFA